MASSPWAERLAAALGSDLPWQALDDDPELAEGVAIEVVAIFETGVPVGRFAEHVIELDRAFRYAARAAENEEDIADLLARGGRPLFVDEGLELTAVMPGSIRFPLIPSERINEVLDSTGYDCSSHHAACSAARMSSAQPSMATRAERSRGPSLSPFSLSNTRKR
jgi:hypothetical protein